MKTYVLTYQKNIRDLGGLEGYNGKHIKFGKFYRGGALHRLTKEDAEVVSSFNLTDVVDFRGEEEFVYQPDYHFDGVEYHNFPAIEERIKKEDRKNDDGNLLWFVGNKNGFEHLKMQYRDLISMKKSQLAYRNFFKLLLKDNRSVYFHCSQGKDRAGLASYLIETILGVSEEEKIRDYLYTNVAMETKIVEVDEQMSSKPFYNEQYRQSLIDVFSAKEEYLEEAKDEMIKISGSILNYIKDILEVDIDKFREMYLE